DRLFSPERRLVGTEIAERRQLFLALARLGCTPRREGPRPELAVVYASERRRTGADQSRRERAGACWERPTAPLAVSRSARFEPPGLWGPSGLERCITD